MTPTLEAALGNRTAACAALYLESYGGGYASQIVEAFKNSAPMSPSMVIKQLNRLEAGGLLVSEPQGRARIYRWNDRLPQVKALRAFVASELEILRDNKDPRLAPLLDRRRPRRKGKVVRPATADAHITGFEPEVVVSQADTMSARSEGTEDIDDK